MRYWLKNDDKAVGPLESRELFNVPGISRSSLICPEPDFGRWRELGRIAELEHLVEMRETCSLLAEQAREHSRERQKQEQAASEAARELQAGLEPLRKELGKAEAEKRKLQGRVASLAETVKDLKTFEYQAMRLQHLQAKLEPELAKNRKEAASLKSRLASALDEIPHLQKELKLKVSQAANELEIRRGQEQDETEKRLGDALRRVEILKNELALRLELAADKDRDHAQLRKKLATETLKLRATQASFAHALLEARRNAKGLRAALEAGLALKAGERTLAAFKTQWALERREHQERLGALERRLEEALSKPIRNDEELRAKRRELAGFKMKLVETEELSQNRQDRERNALARAEADFKAALEKSSEEYIFELEKISKELQSALQKLALAQKQASSAVENMEKASGERQELERSARKLEEALERSKQESHEEFQRIGAESDRKLVDAAKKLAALSSENSRLDAECHAVKSSGRKLEDRLKRVELEIKSLNLELSEALATKVQIEAKLKAGLKEALKAASDAQVEGQAMKEQAKQAVAREQEMSLWAQTLNRQLLAQKESRGKALKELEAAAKELRQRSEEKSSLAAERDEAVSAATQAQTEIKNLRLGYDERGRDLGEALQAHRAASAELAAALAETARLKKLSAEQAAQFKTLEADSRGQITRLEELLKLKTAELETLEKHF